MSEFQTKIHEAFQQAQSKAAARAKEWEQEARKVFETLGDRAQAEFKTLVQTAQKGSRGQIAILGAELEKLGKKLQEIAAKTAAKAASAVNGQTPPGANPPN
ncbi:MAG TPA: hypothetical protein VMK66_14520 [Myxococcales bacterium]|nr:hypothetical protein [Myxococcales bacterium]